MLKGNKCYKNTESRIRGIRNATLNQMLRVSFIDPLHWSRDLKVWERELAPRIQAERPAGDKAQRQEHVWHVRETARRPIWQSRVSQGERSMRWGRRGDGSQIASGLTRPMEECWFLLWGTKMKDHCRVLSEGVITTMITHMQTLLRVRLYKKKSFTDISAFNLHSIPLA